jgi:hypothetical protein
VKRLGRVPSIVDKVTERHELKSLPEKQKTAIVAFRDGLRRFKNTKEEASGGVVVRVDDLKAVFIEEQKISVAPHETTAKRSQASVGGDGNRRLRCLFRPITSDETLTVSRK